jgi:hypothetical protein
LSAGVHAHPQRQNATSSNGSSVHQLRFRKTVIGNGRYQWRLHGARSIKIENQPDLHLSAPVEAAFTLHRSSNLTGLVRVLFRREFGCRITSLIFQRIPSVIYSTVMLFLVFSATQVTAASWAGRFISRYFGRTVSMIRAGIIAQISLFMLAACCPRL